MSGADDETVLAWAADAGRVLVTHDVQTITRFAYDRVPQGLPMLDVFELSRAEPIGVAIDDLVLLAEASECERMGEGQVRYLPLR